MTAEQVIVKAMQAGVLLYVEAGELQYKSRASLSPNLASELKTHRAEVLAVLGDDDGAGTPTKPTPALSAAERAPTDTDETDKTPDYSPYERKVLADAGMAPMDTPLLDSVKQTWPDAAVVSAEAKPVDNPRREAARLICEARQHDRERAIALRDGWRERMARCVIDGRQSEAQAERIALAELRGGDTEPAATLSVDPAAMSQSELQQWISTTAAGTAWHERRCAETPV